jgi:hypothetical protein
MPSGGRKLEWFMLKYISDMQLDTAHNDFLAFRNSVGRHASFTQLLDAFAERLETAEPDPRIHSFIFWNDIAATERPIGSN